MTDLGNHVHGMTTHNHDITNSSSFRDKYKDTFEGVAALSPSYTINGHFLKTRNNCVLCKACDFEMEVPDLVMVGDSLTIQVYKMYLIGKMASSRCTGDMGSNNDLRISDVEGTPPSFGGQHDITVTNDKITTTTNDLSEQQRKMMEKQAKNEMERQMRRARRNRRF